MNLQKRVVLLGQGFTNRTRLACKIGSGEEVTAFLSSSTEITCLDPGPFAEETSTLARASSDGIDFSTGNVVFTHNRTPYLLSIRPLKGPCRGGTSVFLSGAHFPNADRLACTFGALVVPARWLSRELVQCESPPRLETGHVDVQVSADGRLLTSEGLSFLYFKAQVRGVSPSVGPMKGGTLVSVSGEGFVQSENIVVLFGRTRVQGSFVTSSEIQCLTPEQPNAREAQVSVSANGVHVESGSDAIFTFTTSVSLSSIEPSWGFQEDETTMMLYGSGFANTSDFACVFGGNGTRLIATFHSMAAMSCAVPRGTVEGEYEVGLTTNGRTYTGGGPTFSVEKEPTIISMFPTSGPTWGGEAIHVKGFDFKDTAELGCLFGLEAVHARWESSTSLRCTSPAGNAGDSVRFTATLNGRPSSSARHMFMFRDPSVEHCVTGPSSIGVMAAGIRNQSLESAFGHDGTQTTDQLFSRFTLDTALVSRNFPIPEVEDQCGSRTKPAAAAGNASGYVSDSIKDQGSMSFLQAASILRMIPNRGSHDGNTTILVSGTNFVDAENVECAFGESAIPGRWLSPSLLACVSTPRDSQDRVRFGVSINGVASSSSDIFFNYEEYPTVGGMFPSMGSAQGGTPVSFRGNGFKFSSGLTARFGDTAVPVTFISPEELRCTCPPSVPGHVYVLVSDHGQGFSSGGEMMFTYTDAPGVDGLYPSRGSVTGGLKVRVRGRNFANSTSLSCLFGQADVVPGTFVSHTEVECETPAFPGHGPQEMEVTMNGIDFTSDGNVFTYIGAPVAFSITPDSGGASGGTVVLVRGTNFVDSSYLSCYFGSLVVSGRWISSEVVQCVAPPGVANTTVPLAISFAEGQGTISDAEFYFFAEPTFEGISPTFGSIHGGTPVSIFGAGFWFSGELRARFGRTDVSATFVSSSELRCISPASSFPGLSPVLVSENGVDLLGRGGIGFTYMVPTRAVALFPQSGPQSGGTAVVVHGSGFAMESSRLGCMFDEEFVPATYISKTQLSCVTPPATNVRTVHVTIAIEETGSVAEGTVFAYTGESYVSSVHPNSGPVTGGTTIDVNGYNFVDAQDTRCVFGPQRVSASWMSSTRVRCTSPQASRPQEAAFALEVGEGHRVFDGVVFSFYAEPALFVVSPRAGSVEGGTTLDLIGDFPMFSKGFKASFGAVEVPVVFLNSTLLHCTTAASPAQTVEVGVSVGGVRGANELTWPYTFHSKPRVVDIMPSRGSIGGGTIVSVTGDGFEDVPTLGCRFGSSDEQVLSGKFVTTKELICVTPTQADVGSVPLEVSVNGVDFSGNGHRFAYHGSPFITSVSSTYSDRISVHGGYFIDSEALTCRFNESLRTRGKWVSRTLIECALPTPSMIIAFKGNTVALDVSFNGEEQTEAVVIEQERIANLSSLSPRMGSVVGGTTVLIRGSGFVFSGNLRIRFGGVEVPATFLSENLLLCVSPAKEAGFTEVVPKLGMYATPDISVQFQYIHDIKVNSVTAISGDGLETIIIRGDNSISTSQLECRFGGRLRVQPVVMSESEVWCDVPSSIILGQATLEISVNGDVFAPTDFTFVDNMKELWLTLDPSRGPKGGGTPVVVSGEVFPRAVGMECRFGHIAVPAIWLSEEALQCESPAWEEADQVRLTAVVNGYEAGIGYFTYAPTILFSVLPEKGEDSGGTLVTISGYGFDSDRQWVVWFGSEKTRAVVADDEGTSLQCLSPPRASSETLIVLRVSDDFSPPDPRSGVPFEYVPSIEVRSLDPATGSVLGGTSVVVALHHNFGRYKPPLRCVFGEAGYSASTWLNETTVACVSPPSPYRGKVLVSLLPTTTTKLSIGGTTPYWYFYPPTVSFVYPLEVETSSSKPFGLTITGGNFMGSDLLSCRIDETMVGALWISDSVMECSFDGVLPGEHAIEVSNDMVDFVHAGVVRVAFPRGEHAVSPRGATSGRRLTDGGMIIEAFGQGIGTFASVRHCLLGGTALNATTWSTERVECVTAVYEEGTPPSSACNSSDSCSYRIGAMPLVNAPVATRQIPDMGPAHVGSVVKVEKSQSCDRDIEDFWCQSGGSAVMSASPIVEDSMCVIPTDEYGGFNLSEPCSGVGSDAVPLKRFPEITVHDVFPVVVSSDGGSVVHVRGRGFQNAAGEGVTSSSVLCFFDDTSTPAVWVSEALVLCRSPPKAPGMATLHLSSAVLHEMRLPTANISYVAGGRSNNSYILNPAAGPTEGGTVVSIAGTKRMVGPVLCLFGDEAALIVSISTASLACVAPAAVAPGRVKVEIFSSDNKETVGEFEYKTYLTIESVRPAVVDVDGGTTVIAVLQGQLRDIATEGNISCKIGDAVVPALVHPSGSSAECRSPAQPTGSATFSLWSEDNEISRGNFALSYAPLPIISKVSPVDGFSSGEMDVNIYGHDFVYSQDLACLFGDEKATHIEWISTAHMQCTAPKLVPGATHVRVSLDGVRFSSASSFSAYAVHQDIVVDRLDPLVGHAGGGTVVRVSGNSFPLIGGLQCLFGGEESPALVLSETSLECVSPRLSVGMVAMDLIYARGGGRVNRGGTQVWFRVTSEEPIVRFVSPPSGPTQGGTNVVIAGAFLPRTTQCVCRFQGRTSVIDIVADWLSPSAVACTSPRWHQAERAVPLHLLLDGRMVRSTKNASMLFDVNTSPLIEGIHPRVGPESGGTEIRVRGANFCNSSSLACAICKTKSDQCTTVSAVWVSPRELRCITPRHVPGLAAVQLAFGGYKTASIPANFFFAPASHVTNIHPSAGGTGGGTLVLVSGTNLVHTGTAMCRFGDISTKAAFNSDGVVCASPRVNTPRKVFLEVSGNGADFTSDGFVFEFLGSNMGGWSIAAQPSYGDRKGGTEVMVYVAEAPAFETVTGERGYECVFDDLVTPARVASASSVRCRSPPFFMERVASLRLKSTGAKGETAPTIFKFLPAIEIHSLHPAAVQSAGGDPVIVHGTGFLDTSSVCCRFGDTTTPAELLSMTMLRCVAPPWTSKSRSTVIVEVSQNCQDFYGAGLDFRYNDGYYLHARNAPRNASPDSPISDRLQCAVGDTQFANSSRNEHHSLVCSSLVDGLSGSRIKQLDGMGHGSEVSLRSGPMKGGSMVQISGLKAHRDGLYCRFATGARVALVTASPLLHAGSVECPTPPWPTSGTVLLQVTSDDAGVLSVPTPFLYYPQPTLHRMEPSRGTTHGQTMLHIVTSGTSTMAQTSCGFFDSSYTLLGVSIAAWTTKSDVWCPSPLVKPGRVYVEVSSNGVDYTRGSGLALTTAREPIIFSVGPSTGPSTGGTEVEIRGNAFENSDVASCRFDGAVAPAVVVDDTIVLCTAPPTSRQLDTTPILVDLSLTLNGKEVTSSRGALLFTYSAYPRVSVISPRIGPTAGGTRISVEGDKFVDMGHSVECMFGAVATEATVVSMNRLVCDSPPHHDGEVALAVRSDGGKAFLLEGGPNFVFNSSLRTPPTAVPAAFFHSGEETYLPSTSLDNSVSMRRGSRDQIECQFAEVPRREGSEVSGCPLTDSRVEMITPDNGPRVGGTPIVVTGLHFVENDAFTCYFGSRSTGGYVVDTSHLVCSAPPSSVEKAVPFHVTRNGQPLQSNGITYSFKDAPIIVHVQPRFAFQGIGATDIVVTGEGFRNSSALACLLEGGTSLQATFLSEKSAVCSVPKNAGYIQLNITNNGVDFIPSGHGVTFGPQPVVTGIDRSAGSYFDDAYVLVSGLHFANVPGLTCVFGERSTPAEWHSTERVKCKLPTSRVSGVVKVTLTLDRHVLDERSESVAHVPNPSVRLDSVRPAFGASEGGTVVFVEGRHLSGKGDTICRFSRAGDVTAQVLNDSTVRCVSPSSQAGQIRVQIGTSDGSFSGASVAYSYIVRPKVASVQPSAGDMRGGTRVTLQGSYFANITDLECQFGTHSAPRVTFVSAEEIICESPPSLAPTVVPVTVSLNGVASASSLTYRYALGARALDVSPHDESRWLTVTGVHFNQGSGLGCLFNATHSSTAQWLSSSLLRCPIPVTLIPGSEAIGVTVTNNDQDMSTSSASIIIRPRLTIHSVLPATGRWDRDSPVVVVLRAHGLDSLHHVGGQVFCLFDEEPVLAVSSLAPIQQCGLQAEQPLLVCVAVRCTAPAQQTARNSSLQIVDGTGAGLAGPALFVFEETPIVYSISAGFGAFGGGTAVTIEHGLPELSTLPETAGCRFSDAHDAIYVEGKVSAGRSGSLLVGCVSPPWRIYSGLRSVVKLEVVLDGLRRDVGSSFVYSNRANVFSITPRWAMDRGGTQVRIRGIGFSPHPRFSCHFTDEMVPPDAVLTDHLPSIPAIRLSDQDLLCEAPSRPPGPAFITVVADRQRIGGSLEILIRSSAEVNFLSPPQGPTSGGTVVNLTGNNFFFSGSTLCRIGSHKVPATFVSSYSLLCVTPRSSAGIYPVSIAMDGEHFEDSGVSFHYVEEMTDMSLTPFLGWTTGGTNVTVRVAGFQSYGQDPIFLCQFGSHRGAPSEVNVPDGSLVCSSPPQAQTLQGEVNGDSTKTTVSVVDRSGVASVTSTEVFYFVTPVTVTAVVPDRGPPGTHVHVLGENFDGSFGLECLFGNVRTLATLVTSEAVSCRAAAGHTGEASVNLVIGGVLTAWHSRASFTFEQPIVVLSLEPHVGRHGESTAVTIRGRGFRPVADLVCWFGELEAVATFVSSTEVRCHPPPQGRGRVRVSLSAWQEESSAVTLFFSYETEVLIPRLVPAEGSLYGGTPLTVRVDINSTGPDLRCVFSSKDGISASSAMKADGDTIKCKTPPSPGLLAGKTWMSLMQGGIAIAEGARFRFLNPPVLRSIHPRTTYEQAGARLEILGENFVSSKDLACKFSTVLEDGAVLAPAQYISPTKIACITPAWDDALSTGVQVVVDVTVNGVDFTSGGPAFRFQPVAISAVWPSSGPASGGTPVTIFGSLFARQQLSCVFGTSTVSAWVMASSRAVCISPAMTQGFEGSLPLHLAINGRIVTARASAFTYVSAQPRTNIISTSGMHMGIGDPGQHFMRGYDGREKHGLYEVLSVPSLTYLEPSSCSSSGNVNILVHGSNFASSPTMICSFGGVFGRATFLSDIAVQCEAPRHMPAEVLLEVSNDGAAFSASGLTFRFHSDLSIFSVEPSQGPIEGSTLATVTGSHFRQSSYLSCRFGETAVPGRYISSNEVECLTPPMETMGAVVEVQVRFFRREF